MRKSFQSRRAKYVSSVGGIVKLEYAVLAALIIVASSVGIKSLGERVRLKAAVSYIELACKKGGQAVIDSKTAVCNSNMKNCDTEAKLKNLCADYN